MNSTRRRRTLRLRTRVTLFFSLTSLVAGLGLAVATYAVARSFLIDQRQQTAQTQAFTNARTVRDQLLVEEQFDVATLRTESGGFPVLVLDGVQYTADSRYSLETFPLELRTAVAQGQSAQQRFEYRGDPYVAVGVNMPSVNAQYLEAFPMESTQRTISRIATEAVFQPEATSSPNIDAFAAS